MVRALWTVAAGLLAAALFFRSPPLPRGSAQFSARAPVPGQTYAIDAVDFAGRSVPPEKLTTIRGAGPITIRGWAVDPATLAPGQTLLVSIDGAPGAPVTTYGSTRPDLAVPVAASAVNSGFTAVIPANRLRAGKNDIRFILLVNDGRQVTLPTPISFAYSPAKSPS